jgi:hypothetical protein
MPTQGLDCPSLGLEFFAVRRSGVHVAHRKVAALVGEHEETPAGGGFRDADFPAVAIGPAGEAPPVVLDFLDACLEGQSLGY